MRATPVLLLVVPWAIAANQPTFTYPVPNNTRVAAMTVDAAGNTYLTGSTTSSNFPATQGALQTQFSGGICQSMPGFHGVPLTFPCADAFVIKLDPSGNVVFATYFGGNGNVTVASAICVDAGGNIYLGGLTGPNSMGQPATFPVTPGAAFANVANGGGFVAKLNSSGTALVYSTILPGSGRSMAIAVNSAGEVYIATTTSGAQPFPTTPGAFQTAPPSYQGGSGVIAKLNASGSALLYATYLAADNLIVPEAIAIDAAGDAFVCGFTQATDFPVTDGAFQTEFFAGAQYMEFVTKLNPQGTGLIYSTFLGSTQPDVSQIQVDAQGGAYVVAMDGALSSGGYLSHVSTDGSKLVYSTYVPTVTELHLALDSAGSAFVAGVSGLGILTPSPGAFQSGSIGNTGSDVTAAKFTSNGEFAGATYAHVAAAAGGGSLIAVAPSGAIMLAEGNPEMTVVGIVPWLTVENAASGTSGTVAPGEIVTLRGYGLGPTTAAVAPGAMPADQLGGTQVTFGGFTAPVFSAQSQQVTVQVPWEIAGEKSTEVVVTYNGGPPAGTSSSVVAVVAKATPGIFAVANSDGTLNSSSNPARAGSYISIYGTGGGVTNPLGKTGELWPPSLARLNLPVSVSISGTNASVLYAGSAPTLESGYFQINAALPPGLKASSPMDLVVTVAGSSSVAVPISIQ